MTRQDYTIEDYAIASVEERRNLFINLGMMLADSDSQWLREACEMLLVIIPVTNATQRDSTRQDVTGLDDTGQDKTEPDGTRQDRMRRDETRRDKARRDVIRQDKT